MDTVFILAGSNSPQLSKRIAIEMRAELVYPIVRKFPDGELYVRISRKLSDSVVAVQSMFPNQNDALIELLLLTNAAIAAGARKLIAVVPYFCYARQDRRFLNGEALSAEVIAGALKSAEIARVVTFDLHFFRKEGSFSYHGVKFSNLSAANLLLSAVEEKFGVDDFAIVCPDRQAFEMAYLSKKKVEILSFDKHKICPKCKKQARYCKCVGKKEYAISSVDVHKTKLAGKNVVILDDMISTGATIVSAASAAKNAGAEKIFCAATHGLFVDNNFLKLMKKFSTGIITTDSIELSFPGVEKISIAPVVAEWLRKFNNL